MNSFEQIIRAAALAAIAGAASVGAAQNARVFSANGQGVSASSSDGHTKRLGFNRWLDEETIASNQDIFANREAIAQLAVWVGPGPGNIQPIMAGDTGWLDRMNEEAAIEFAANGGMNLPQVILLANQARRVISPIDDAGGPSSFGGTPSNEAHRVNRLWPTATVDGQIVARIPYSFSEDMITAWVNRGAPEPDPVDQNAVAGIASTLATMLILEQVLPVQFVGLNPQVDPENGFLLVENQQDSDFDPLTGIGTNGVTRIGRANTANEDEEPTQITHETWSNFPSLVRSLGFVLGLDWEQRHPDRDLFLDIQPQNILPQDFPLPAPSPDGNLGPGVTALTSPDPDLADPTTAGPLLFDDITLLTIEVDTPGCGFDLDSMMLIRPFDLGGAAMYFIRDAFRYIDLDGDAVVDTTPFGPDDRMVNQPVALFFSDCDIAAIEEMYSVEFRWYYGFNPDCPHDVNNDGIQGADDLQAFVALWEARDPSADLVPPFGFIDLLDLQAFSLGDDANNIDIFTPGFCNPFGPPGPGFRPGGNVFPPEG
jgi:hypothetical protein